MPQRKGSAQPRYLEIAGDLRARIDSGELPPGAQLPTKAALMASYTVALNTVERAIEELRRAGYVETFQGKGMYARTPPVPQASAEYAAISERISAIEARLDGRIDDLDAKIEGLEPPEAATRPEPVPVVAAVVTSGSAVLITRRKDGTPPYGFVSGEIEPGESPAQAGEREVKEETGLMVTAGPEIGRRVHPATSRTIIYMAAYPASPAHTEVFVGDESELDAVMWVDEAEALRLLPAMFEPVAAYLARVLRS